MENLRLPATSTSREWFRPNPPLPSIKWGPRNNTNIQQSAILFSLHHVAEHKQLYLENYWLKNRRSVEKGKDGPTFAWVIPAAQRRKADAAQAVNDLRRQGLEFHRATRTFQAGAIEVRPGDYIVRADQPYRTLADMYFALQNYAIGNPRPYDDTGWTFQLMRNLTVLAVGEKGILDQPMTPVSADVTAPGGIEGAGSVLVVEHTTDNNLMAFRFKHAGVKMLAAEDDFDAAGRRFLAGAFIIPNADRATLGPTLTSLGLSAWAVAEAPTVKTHELDVPRIGYVHAWQRTQDEGWVRAALDTYGVSYTYFADQKLREGGLRQKYDVIILPHVGGNAQSQVNGIPKTSDTPLPYQKTADTPNLGANDRSDDIRGGMGLEGLVELARFVEEGGTLLVEGSTSTIFPEYGITRGVTVESSDRLFARGSILRGLIKDKKSPLVYGYDGDQLAVYFNQDPVLNAGAGGIPSEFAGFFGGGQGQIPGVGQNITPMATPLRLSPWEADSTQPSGAQRPQVDEVAAFRQMARQFGVNLDDARPRVVMAFPANTNDLLLSGTLAGGQVLSNRAQLVDAPLGKGHVVMFAIRPFWRWQTQGTFFLGFNAILNWNDLDAGKPATQEPPVGEQRGR